MICDDKRNEDRTIEKRRACSDLPSQVSHKIVSVCLIFDYMQRVTLSDILTKKQPQHMKAFKRRTFPTDRPKKFLLHQKAKLPLLMHLTTTEPRPRLPPLTKHQNRHPAVHEHGWFPTPTRMFRCGVERAVLLVPSFANIFAVVAILIYRTGSPNTTRVNETPGIVKKMFWSPYRMAQRLNQIALLCLFRQKDTKRQCWRFGSGHIALNETLTLPVIIVL